MEDTSLKSDISLPLENYELDDLPVANTRCVSSSSSERSIQLKESSDDGNNNTVTKDAKRKSCHDVPCRAPDRKPKKQRRNAVVFEKGTHFPFLENSVGNFDTTTELFTYLHLQASFIGIKEDFEETCYSDANNS